MATSGKASFFKVLDGDDFYEKLRIPKAFRRHFYGMVPEKCQLRIGTQTWLVDIEIACLKLYFKNGWKKFVQDNRLKGFEFLTFSYDGKSEFYVNIYGADTCKRKFREISEEESDDSESNDGSKIEEPDSDDTSEQPDDDDEDEDENEDDENEAGSEDSIINVESDEDDEAEFAQFSKAETEKRSSGFHKRKMFTCQVEAQKRKRHVSGSPTDPKSEGQKKFGTAELIARHSAKPLMSKSVKPSCMIVMTFSYVTGSFLHFPFAIANKHLNKSCSHLNLRIGKKCWSVAIYRETNSFRLQAGWPGFVNANDLKKGDVCVFVLSEANHGVFDVTIFRV